MAHVVRNQLHAERGPRRREDPSVAIHDVAAGRLDREHPYGVVHRARAEVVGLDHLELEQAAEEHREHEQDERGDPRHALLDVGLVAAADALVEPDDHGTHLRVAIRSGRRPTSSPATHDTSPVTIQLTTGAEIALTATRGRTTQKRGGVKSALGVKSAVSPTTPIACATVSAAAKVICGSPPIRLT
jgi:hypothetical protein